MNSKLRKLSKRPFVRNVAIVATGTAAAQAVTMAFAPIITRLYGPETFGVLGVFMAMVGIITPVAALTYPIAIVLPKSDADAKCLARLSLYISLLMAVLATIILVLFKSMIVSLFHIEVIESFLFLIPLVILFSAFLQVAQQWLLRTKEFRIIAKVEFVKAIIINSAKVGFGLLKPVAAVLVVLATLGSALHALMLFIGAQRSQHEHVAECCNIKTIKELSRKYEDFPIFRAPQSLINAISQSLPVLLLAIFFGPASAGFYSLGKTVLSVPTQLISKSVGDVFYPRIAEAANNGENLTRLIVKATLGLSAVGVIPFGFVMVFGPWIFGVVFGEEWVMAGEYARWLALWLLFGFINRPSVKAIPVLNLQGQLLLYEVMSVVIRAGALFLGFHIYNNDIYAVIFFSAISVALNALIIIYTIWKSMFFYNSSKVLSE